MSPGIAWEQGKIKIVDLFLELSNVLKKYFCFVVVGNYKNWVTIKTEFSTL